MAGIVIGWPPITERLYQDAEQRLSKKDVGCGWKKEETLQDHRDLEPA